MQKQVVIPHVFMLFLTVLKGPLISNMTSIFPWFFVGKTSHHLGAPGRGLFEGTYLVQRGYELKAQPGEVEEEQLELLGFWNNFNHPHPKVLGFWGFWKLDLQGRCKWRVHYYNLPTYPDMVIYVGKWLWLVHLFNHFTSIYGHFATCQFVPTKNLINLMGWWWKSAGEESFQ